jgi:hypothetical protein
MFSFTQFTEYTVPKAHDLLYDIANTIQKMGVQCACKSEVPLYLPSIELVNEKEIYTHDLHDL